MHAGDTPVASEVLGAWLLPTRTTLEISDDRAGSRRWLTGSESTEQSQAEAQRERAEKEYERAEKTRERTERLALERSLAEMCAKG